MFKISDIVENTLEASSLLEAEQNLFGSKGIVLNSKPYYENIIANFITKKESIMTKTDASNIKTLSFDLNNFNDLWNIMFIYKYYIKYCDKKCDETKSKINEINQKKSELQAEKWKLLDNFPKELNEEIEQKNRMIRKICENTSKTKDEKDKETQEILIEIEKIKNKNEYYKQISEKIEELIKEVNRLNILKNKYHYNDNNKLKKFNVTLLNGEKLAGKNLDKNINEIKEAINCIQLLKDSFGHKNSELELKDMVFIDNVTNKLEIEIPISYLNGFNNGLIIAKDEDSNIVEETNKIFNYLNFDIKKLKCFNYNIDPEYVGFLYKNVNYDIEKIRNLSNNIFIYKDKVKKFIEKGFDLDSISKFSDTIFLYSVDDIINFEKQGINIYDVPPYLNFPRNIFFKYSSSIIQFIDEGIMIFNLAEQAFEYPEETIALKEEGFNIYKLKDFAFEYPKHTKRLKEEGFDVYELANSAFEYPEHTKRLKKAGFDVYKLPNIAFRYPDATIKFINEGINVLGFTEIEYEYPDATIKFINRGINVLQLPEIAYEYPDKTIDLIETMNDISLLFDYDFLTIEKLKETDNNSIEAYIEIKKSEATKRFKELDIDFSNLPNIAYQNPEKTIKLKEEGINLYDIPDIAYLHPKATIRYKEEGINLYDIPKIAYPFPEATIQLKKEGINLSSLPYGGYWAFANPKEAIKLYKKIGNQVYKLPYGAYNNIDRTNELIDAEIDVSSLSYWAYEYPEGAIILKKAGFNLDDIPNVAYEYPASAIILKKAGFNLYDIPNIAYESPFKFIELKNIVLDDIKFSKIIDKFGKDLKNIKINTFKEIIDKVGYDQLDSLPVEFFCCESNQLDEMFMKYNLNISRSIYGIQNPKMIGVCIYASSVLTNCIKTNPIDCRNIDFDPIFKAIGVDKSQKSEEEINEMKEDILNKLRNSSAHSRFKLVKDSNGNINEKKINIYDEDNQGNVNFNIIIDLNDFFSIIKKIEEQLKLENNQILTTENVVRKI